MYSYSLHKNMSPRFPTKTIIYYYKGSMSWWLSKIFSPTVC